MEEVVAVASVATNEVIDEVARGGPQPGARGGALQDLQVVFEPTLCFLARRGAVFAFLRGRELVCNAAEDVGVALYATGRPRLVPGRLKRLVELVEQRPIRRAGVRQIPFFCASLTTARISSRRS